jgi:hypothetical protein
MSQPDHHRPEAQSAQNTKSWSQSVRELHELYCHWTAQTLSLRFDRERLWYEFLSAGFSAEDLKRVVTYLQKEIRTERRNIGALKLSNLLQLDPSRKILTSAASDLSRQPRVQTPLLSPHLIRTSTTRNAKGFASNLGSSASNWAATTPLSSAKCYNSISATYLSLTLEIV